MYRETQFLYNSYIHIVTVIIYFLIIISSFNSLIFFLWDFQDFPSKEIDFR